MNDVIGQTFNVKRQTIVVAANTTANTTVTTADTTPVVNPFEQDLTSDYKSSRTNFDILIDQGQLALQDILTLASQSQHPRMFEVAALMIKTLAETNASKLDVHEKLYKIKKLQNDVGVGTGTGPIKNAIFVGSTSELLKHIKPRNVTIDGEVS